MTNPKNQIELAKLTSILPVNNYALKDGYFKNYRQGDIISKARVLSAKQLNNLQKNIRFKNNHKEILTLLNTTVQTILLGNGDIKNTLENTAKDWKKLE